MSRLAANAVLLLAAALWGGSFAAQSTAMAKLGPLWFTALRFALAAVVLSPLAWAEHRRARRPLSRRDLLLFAGLAVVFCTGTVLQQFAMLTTSVTNVGVLTGLYVLFVPGLELVVLRRRPSVWIWPAAVLALAGTWLLGGGDFARLRVGDTLTIVAALFFAAQISLLGLLVMRTGRPATAAWAQALGCILAGLPALATEPLQGSAILAAAPELAYAGVVSGGLAFMLQAVAQRYSSASEAAIVLMSEALFAAALAALLLGERVSTSGGVGCALIFAGIVVVQAMPLLQNRLPSRRRAAA